MIIVGVILFVKGNLYIRNKGVLLSTERRWNQPAQLYSDGKYFKLIELSYKMNGETCIGTKTLVTQKGLEFIKKVLDEHITGQ